MSAVELHERFESAQSFMYFAEGLRAMRNFRVRFSERDLEESINAFRAGVAAYPGEALLHYYLALMLLETCSEQAPSPHPTLRKKASVEFYARENQSASREETVFNSLVEFERYQDLRTQRKNTEGTQHQKARSEWLYLWSEYNRAAAQMHRLVPRGYLRARGILKKHIKLEQPDYWRDFNVKEDVHLEPGLGGESALGGSAESAMPADSRKHTQIDLSYVVPPTRLERFLSFLPVPFRRLVIGIGGSHPNLRNVHLPEGMQRLIKQSGAEDEWRTLSLQMESLFMLTRSRPLREPETMRRGARVEEAFAVDDGAVDAVDLDDLGPEPLERVYESLSRFIKRVKIVYQRKEISDTVYRDLTSDYWSQLGHLHCRRALDAADVTPEYLRSRWPLLDRSLDNAAVFRLLLRSPAAPVRAHLKDAQLCFRTALAHQPNWRPAQKNLLEVEQILSSDRPNTEN